MVILKSPYFKGWARVLEVTDVAGTVFLLT